jgi:large subunit ribosomal protein L13
MFNYNIMDALSYKTKSASSHRYKEWIVVDADGHNLGRLASKVAMILRGKYNKLHTAR